MQAVSALRRAARRHRRLRGTVSAGGLDMPTAVRNYAAYRRERRRVDARTIRRSGRAARRARRASSRRDRHAMPLPMRLIASCSARTSRPDIDAASRVQSRACADIRRSTPSRRSSRRRRRSSERPRCSRGEFELFAELPADAIRDRSSRRWRAPERSAKIRTGRRHARRISAGARTSLASCGAASTRACRSRRRPVCTTRCAPSIR